MKISPVCEIRHTRLACFGAALSLCLLLLAPAIARCQPTATEDQVAALNLITAESLQAHLSYIASDELGGRGTPSPGLEAAAIYIAEQFRKAGLEPVGNDGYFQTSRWVMAPVVREGRTSTRLRLQPWEEGTERPEGAQGEPFLLKNVVGLLRGSDPELRDSYILVTAHYDHLGIRSGVAPDSIYNGANDDGSGTVTVFELARALASAETPPGRSILFMAVFGEESGLLGSRHYAQHPIFPLRQTIAMANIEMIGRTDTDGVDNTGNLNITGFNLSTFSVPFVEAGKHFDIAVFRHAQNSLPYFRRSDNIALATLGVPAHTFSVGYSHDDYHRPDDHWEKINFPNMAVTARTIGLGVLYLANSDEVPVWNEGAEGVEPYLEAWKTLHGGG